jgi:hypothetical protein
MAGLNCMGRLLVPDGACDAAPAARRRRCRDVRMTTEHRTQQRGSSAHGRRARRRATCANVAWVKVPPPVAMMPRKPLPVLPRLNGG